MSEQTPLFIRARRGTWTADFELAGLHREPPGHGGAFAMPLVFQSVEEGQGIAPFTTLTQQGAQVLMDDLWNAGLRPSAMEDTATGISALRAHLGDLQQLVRWSYDPELQLKMQKLYGNGE